MRVPKTPLPVMFIPWLDWLRYRVGIFDVRGTLVDLDPEYQEILYLKIINDFGRRTGNRYLMSFNEDDLEQLLLMKTSRRQAYECYEVAKDEGLERVRIGNLLLLS